jgi:hypothetical protein
MRHSSIPPVMTFRSLFDQQGRRSHEIYCGIWRLVQHAGGQTEWSVPAIRGWRLREDVLESYLSRSKRIQKEPTEYGTLSNSDRKLEMRGFQ